MSTFEYVASQPIDIAHLVESKTNPRRTWSKDQLSELTESIRAHGVLQPLLVRPTGDGGTFEVIAGARRFRAAKAAGQTKVPCLIRVLDDREVLEVQFIENLQRADLHPLDEGLGYAALVKEHGYTVAALAERLDKSEAYVYGRMQLSKLPVKAQALFFDGKFDVSQALLIVTIADEKLRAEAAALLAKEQVGYRDAKDLVRRNYQLDLGRAPFDTASKTLTSAGACGPCPHRLGNQSTLFGEPAEKGRANLCTSRTCYEAKTAAAFALAEAKVIEAGGKVLRGPEANQARHGGHVIDVAGGDGTYVNGKWTAWKAILKGQKVPQVLIEGRDGEAQLFVARKDAEAAAKRNGHTVSNSGYTASPSQKAAEAKRRAEGKARSSLLPKLVEVAEKAELLTILRLVLADVTHATQTLIAKRRGSSWKALCAEEKLGVLCGLIAEAHACAYGRPDQGPFDHTAKALGLNPKVLVAQAVKAAKKPKPKPKKAAKGKGGAK